METRIEGDSQKTPRRRWGRRKLDWMIPLILLILMVLTGLWAFDNYSKRQQMEQINKTLAVQSKLLEHLLEHNDRKRAATPTPPPSTPPVITPPTGAPPASTPPAIAPPLTAPTTVAPTTVAPSASTPSPIENVR